MIDKRRNYVLMLDTETANTLTNEDGTLDMSNVLIYDCGWAVIDTKGNLYETASYINKDIFEGERDLMQSAYYADKIPRYLTELAEGRRQMATTYEIRAAMLDTIKKYGIKYACAHNARFDYNALNITQRWTTASRFRYWFPFDSIEFWDTQKMAQDVICKMPTYKQFCADHGYITPKGQPRRTAEILYRYISGNHNFVESHTGLEDVLIEAEIMWYCFRQHKPMRKLLFENPTERIASTSFQRDLLANIKKTPTIQTVYQKGR